MPFVQTSYYSVLKKPQSFKAGTCIYMRACAGQDPVAVTARGGWSSQKLGLVLKEIMSIFKVKKSTNKKCYVEKKQAGSNCIVIH